MRRKKTRSHTYTILGLLAVIVTGSSILAHGYLNDEESDVATTQQQQETSSVLRVEDSENSGYQVAPSDSSALLQSPASGVQAAGDVEIYENYNNQRAQSTQPQ